MGGNAVAARHRLSPNPDPRYSSPASSQGSTPPPISNFANGVLAPNKTAEAIANPAPRAIECCPLIAVRS